MLPAGTHTDETSLGNALNALQEHASRGYDVASSAISLLRRVIGEASHSLETQIRTLDQLGVSDSVAKDILYEQLNSIHADFKALPYRLDEDVNLLSRKGFSITLFGRTGAGKSTLMEILTRGNGASIGSGGQRTTRDVRTYDYRGLSITDVPGVAAFEGMEDEKIAFKAAKKSDLILFMITSDSPQMSEAEALTKIFSLGKPVICVINIKAELSPSANMKVFQRDLQREFRQERIAELRKQFLEFGRESGQVWSNVRFVETHLKAAFCSRQEEYQQVSETLWGLSNFGRVELLIEKEIELNGGFYKYKAFSDAVTVPMISTSEVLFSQGAENSKIGEMLLDKKRDLIRWKKTFERYGRNQINEFISRYKADLKRQAVRIAERHSNNRHAAMGEWIELNSSYNIEARAKVLWQTLERECNERLEEMNRQMDTQIRFIVQDFGNTAYHATQQFRGSNKAAPGWVGGIVGVGLSAALIAFGGIRLAPIALAVIGLDFNKILEFFREPESREQVQKNRKTIEQGLTRQVDLALGELHYQLASALDNLLLKGHLDSTIASLDQAVNILFTLSETQQKIAHSLSHRLSRINKDLISEALIFLKEEDSRHLIQNVARIPGYAHIIFLQSGEQFPTQARNALSRLFGETTWFVYNHEYPKVLISRVIGHGINRGDISIQKINGEPRIVRIPLVDSAQVDTQNRIRMAQQVSGLLIRN